MNNNIKVIKISCAGGSKVFMHIEYNNIKYCLHIKRELYEQLKQNGVPTVQSLRGKKNK